MRVNYKLFDKKKSNYLVVSSRTNSINRYSRAQSVSHQKYNNTSIFLFEVRLRLLEQQTTSVSLKVLQFLGLNAFVDYSNCLKMDLKHYPIF